MEKVPNLPHPCQHLVLSVFVWSFGYTNRCIVISDCCFCLDFLTFKKSDSRFIFSTWKKHCRKLWMLNSTYTCTNYWIVMETEINLQTRSSKHWKNVISNFLV
jgi:hypothetical protein